MVKGLTDAEAREPRVERLLRACELLLIEPRAEMAGTPMAAEFFSSHLGASETYRMPIRPFLMRLPVSSSISTERTLPIALWETTHTLRPSRSTRVAQRRPSAPESPAA